MSPDIRTARQGEAQTARTYTVFVLPGENVSCQVSVLAPDELLIGTPFWLRTYRAIGKSPGTAADQDRVAEVGVRSLIARLVGGEGGTERSVVKVPLGDGPDGEPSVKRAMTTTAVPLRS